MNADESRKRTGFAVRLFFTGPRVMAAVWFVAAFVALVFAWGMNPLTFPSPDEAVNRLAAALTEEHGRPFLRLPFVDKEDLVHPRLWVTLDDYAVPAYAPLAFYFYAALMKVPVVGSWLISLLPASAAAAFTLGTARLLPRGRRWLALLSPVLGFPALYWLLRPWMNISLLLVCICWAFLFWVNWRATERGTRRTRWLLSALAFVGAGAAVRPDYAAYLMLAALLFSLAESQGEWRLILLAVFGAGTAAVLVNLFLNWLITGHPLVAAYQILMAREPGAGGPTLLPGILNSLLTPMGLHTPRQLWPVFAKYWLNLRPLGLLVVGQVSLLPLLYALPRRKRLLYLAAIVVLLCFVVTRLADDVYGAKFKAGYIHHSVPRYLTPVYLLAALPPLLFLGRGRIGVTRGLGTVLACILALRGGYEICVRQPESLAYIRKLALRDRNMLDTLATTVPPRALVYTVTRDKSLWSRWQVGLVGDPKPTAASMSHALAADMTVFLFEPRFGSARVRALERALKGKRLGLTTVDSKQGLYQVEPASPL